MNTLDEIWMPVKGYEGKYLVSNLGNVVSIVSGQHRKRALPVDAKGYPVVGLWKENKRKECKVHRLVAAAFLPNPEGKRTVNHKDGDKTNNCVTNLEWATHGENKSHAFKVLGEQHWLKNKKDRQCPYSKYVEQLEIDSYHPVAVYFGTRAAHRVTGISQGNIASVCRGERPHAGGFLWRYINV